MVRTGNAVRQLEIQKGVFRDFGGDFGRTALARLADRSSLQTEEWQSRSAQHQRSAPTHPDVRHSNVSAQTTMVPSYMLNEAEYIRTFGY